MQLTRRARVAIPESIRTALSPVYYRYHEVSANQRHKPPDRTLEPADFAPVHVLLVVVDALRPDHVPSLSIPFTTAVSPSTWTFPAVTSFHTGLYPNEHRSVARTALDDEVYAMPEQTTAEPYLPLQLESAGYETYAGCSILMPFLALRGWYQQHKLYRFGSAARVIDDYLAWRRGRDRTFGYLHLGDLHAPLNPPEEYVRRNRVDTALHDIERFGVYTDSYEGGQACRYFREHRLRLYRAALEYVEDILGPLVAELARDTFIVVTGDHGEAHWEHFELDRQFTDSRPNYGVGHGGTPFDTVARVPVGCTVEDALPSGGWGSLVDIPYTIISEVLEDPGFDGITWRESIPRDRIAFCEAPRYGVERKAAYQGEYKLIRSEADDVTVTATIPPDGDERFGSIPESVRETLLDLLPTRWDTTDDTAGTSAFVQSQLEALGYQ